MTSVSKDCIAVLSRGHGDMKGYEMIIERNRHISKNLENKSTVLFIFHEGNIQEVHQRKIQESTPELNIVFRNVRDIAFPESKKNVKMVTEKKYGDLGYRHMCSFWFIDFFEAVTDYDKVIRIDDDCLVGFSIDNMFSNLDKYTFVAGGASPDGKEVTKWLNKFSLDFINKHKETYSFPDTKPRDPKGPNTQLMGFSIPKIRENEMFQKYKEDVKASDHIYRYRWGDLPLWGEAIQYIFGVNSILYDKSLRYYHGSHKKKMNYNRAKGLP
jgi:hypothetical protein